MGAKDMVLAMSEAGMAYRGDLGFYGDLAYTSTMSGLSELLDSQDPALAILAMSETAVEQLWSAAQPAIQRVVSDITSGISTSLAGNVASSIAGAAGGIMAMVPMIGAFVGTMFEIDSAVQAQTDAVNRQNLANAAERFKQPYPSGGVQILPCDLFHPTDDKWDHRIDDVEGPWGEYPVIDFSVGTVLAICTEGAGTSVSSAPAHSPQLAGKSIWLYSVPYAKRQLLRKLRHAITAARVEPSTSMYAKPLGDGGASAWPIYLDMIMAEVYANRLTEETARHSYEARLGEVCVNEPWHAAACTKTRNLGTTFRAPFNAVFGPRGLLYAHHRKSNPIYTQDKNALEAAKKAAASVRLKSRRKKAAWAG